MFQHIELPTCILSNIYHNHIGIVTNIDDSSIQVKFNMNSQQEVSFDVYKEVDGQVCELWDKIVSLKYIFIPEHNEYYKIDVTIDENDNTVKHLTLTSASEYELSNKTIRNLEINTESDILRQKYNTTVPEYTPNVLYNPSDPSNSILHRALADKAPDWSIGHVDDSIAHIQRTFSVNNQKIYDFLVKTLAEEIGCLFQFDSVTRTISAYDLMNQCENCGKRGEFTGTCPECGGHLITPGYGTNTNILINYNNYAESISVDHDEDAVKNCFYVTGGDELINAAVRNCNPSGSGYVYRFSNADYEDMPSALVNRLRAYEAKYEELQPTYQTLAEQWYDAVNEYWYYKTSMMPRMYQDGSKWEANKGYNVGARAYVRTQPTWCYLECIQSGTSSETEFDATSLVDNEEITDGTVIWKAHKHILDLENATQSLQTIRTELGKADNIIYFLNNVPAISVVNTEIKNIASLYVNNLFRIEIITDEHNYVDGNNVWYGNIRVYNTGAKEDTITSETPVIAYLGVVSDATEYGNYMNAKIQKRLDKSDTTFTNIWSLDDDELFKAQLKLYAFDSLEYFSKSYQGCLETLVNSGVKAPDYKFEGFDMKTYYDNYANRLEWVNEEMALRDEQVKGLKAKRDDLEYQMNEIQKQLDLIKFLGEDLYKVLYNYIREDSYQNSNYVSTGLSDGEQINYGKKLLELATEELEKACKLQVTLSMNVKNMLNTEEFKDYKEVFEIGDYIMCTIDDEVYRLRLMSVSYNYSNPEDIELTFSNYTNVENFFSDAKNVIESAKSISLSYNSVVHQVDQNTKASVIVDSYSDQGVGGNGTSISSNSMNEVVVENNGILAREYDDVLQVFKPQQMRIGANQISLTTDNWKTTKVGIGKQVFTVHERDTWTNVTKEEYGVSADYMFGGYIQGTDIVAGYLYSANYEPGSTQGSYINLESGEFDFAAGSFIGVWHEDENEYEVTLKGNVNISGNLVPGTTIGKWTVYEDGLKSDGHMITPDRIDVHEYYQDGKPFSGGGGGNSNLRHMLWEDYEALPDSEKMEENTLFMITNIESEPGCVSYIPMTYETYQNLPDSKLTDGIMRLINDQGVIYVNGVVYGASGTGGSTVTIEPTLTAGTQIAVFTIDGVEGILYAPAGGAGGVSDVIVNNESVVVDGTAYIDLTTKQDVLTFDSSPTASSTNPVTSNGIYAALQGKQNVLTQGDNITISNGVISATDTTYSVFTGATAQTSGTSGLVVAPLNVDYDKFLRGDGTWAYPSGGGGSTVSITPTLSSGTKIADFEIDGVSGVLYAPTGGGGAIDDVTVDGTSVVTNRVAEIDLSGKQDVLTAGTNITITNNTISATDTTYSDFVGATSSTAGANGLVPQPLVADKDKFLKGDGTWATPSGSGGGVLYGTTVPSPSIGEDGSQYAQYNATNNTVSYMYFKINGVWMPYQPNEAADAFVDIDNEPFVTEDGDTILFVE